MTFHHTPKSTVVLSLLFSIWLLMDSLAFEITILCYRGLESCDAFRVGSLMSNGKILKFMELNIKIKREIHYVYFWPRIWTWNKERINIYKMNWCSGRKWVLECLIKCGEGRVLKEKAEDLINRASKMDPNSSKYYQIPLIKAFISKILIFILFNLRLQLFLFSDNCIRKIYIKTYILLLIIIIMS